MGTKEEIGKLLTEVRNYQPNAEPGNLATLLEAEAILLLAERMGEIAMTIAGVSSNLGSLAATMAAVMDKGKPMAIRVTEKK